MGSSGQRFPQPSALLSRELWLPSSACEGSSPAPRSFLFLLIGERIGKIVSVFTHKVQEIFDFPITFGTLLLGIDVPIPKLLK